MGELIDLTGKRFGRLTVIERDYKKQKIKNNKYVYWKCICDCGNKKSISSQSLRTGRTRSCGCLSIEKAHCNTGKNLLLENKKVLVEGTNLNRICPKKNPVNNTSGTIGVCFDKSRQKWLAYLKLNGRSILNKSFSNKQDVINAHKEAEEKYFKLILEKHGYEKFS